MIRARRFPGLPANVSAHAPTCNTPSFIGAAVHSRRGCATVGANSNAAAATPPPWVASSGGSDGISSALLTLDDTKAGMSMVDKGRAERIIEAASRGSSFYANEQRKAQQRVERLAKSKEKLAAFDKLRGKAKKDQIRKLNSRCDEVLAAARAKVEIGCFVSIDMDAFYASVEEQLHPELKGLAFGVGDKRMLSTSSYEARKYGVRAGMPGFVALRLCPHLRLSFSGFEHYRRYSAVFKRIVAEYDARYNSMGLDEVSMRLDTWLADKRGRVPLYPDLYPVTSKLAPLVDAKSISLPVSASVSSATTAEQVAFEIRARVYAECGLTASAGIGPTAAISKILSNFEKPDGQCTLHASSPDDLERFMADQPIRRIMGVGRATEEHLAGLGYTHCADVVRDRVRLCHVLTPKSFESLLTACVGCQHGFTGHGDANAPEGTAAANVAASVLPKSVSAESTFDTVESMKKWDKVVSGVFARAHGQLRAKGLQTCKVILSIKEVSFARHQNTRGLVAHTDDKDALFEAFKALVDSRIGEGHANVRLLGCRFTELRRVAAAASPPEKSPQAAPVASKPSRRKLPSKKSSPQDQDQLAADETRRILDRLGQ